MSDMDLESPDADSVEQSVAAAPADSDTDEEPELVEAPLEADPADAEEQARVLDVDDDEYR